ncbi:hypothetical protein V1281_001006 [Nitrobacteraceae bacterium AZCC 2161]
MASYDHYLHELQTQLRRATKRRANEVIVNSGELNQAMGSPSGFFENCFEAMDSEIGPGDEVLADRNSGSGMTVRYVLPRREPL